MTLADLAITVVIVSGCCIVAVIGRVLWKLAYGAFSAALDSVARDLD